MKNVVSFETAIALKEAGFPQPEPEAEQFWYNPDFGLFVVGPRSHGFAYRHISIFYPETGKVYEKEQGKFSDCVFAPDVADILKQLPGWYASLDRTKWVCVNGYPEKGDKEHINDNPAEAAAAAWLQTHRKKDLEI